ncbi:MAG: pectin esterase [Prevotella sp.]|nr:pectin esterase [Prevotella sp.]
MRKYYPILGLLLFLVLLSSGKKQTTVFIIGDSTAADKSSPQTNPERGWGMVLQGFFDRHVDVDNHAVNGRSSKSFIDEGRWQRVLDRMKPGDYVIIQFGHNDEKDDPKRHTVPGGSFDDNLRRFAQETLDRGAHPVLMNAVVRRNFYRQTDLSVDDESLRNTSYEGETVNSDTLIDTHGDYLLSPRRVAAALGIPFIDANRITHDLEQSLGIEGSRRLHMWYRPGEVASIPNGRHDNTHYNVYGARLVAGLLVDALAKEIPALRRHVRHFDYVVSAEGRGNYLTWQEAVEAIPEGGRAKVLILDEPKVKIPAQKGKKVKFVRR